MFRPELVQKLSEEERDILRRYSERVLQCQAQLKGDSHPVTTDRPAPMLPVYSLSPEREEITVESVPADFSTSIDKKTPKKSSMRSSRSSLSGTPRHDQYAEPTYSSRMRSKSPRDHLHSPSNKRTKGKLDLRLIPNLEAEVGKLLRITHRYAQRSSELKAELMTTSELYRKYAGAKTLGKR